MRAYWLERFTPAEIVALAEALWGPREEWRRSASHATRSRVELSGAGSDATPPGLQSLVAV
jgi:hypothetical protein